MTRIVEPCLRDDVEAMIQPRFESKQDAASFTLRAWIKNNAFQ